MAEFDVCALGELLIDFTENGISENGNPIMEANPGGAPCNVQEAGINTDGLVTDESVNTTLAFVHTLPGGDREFSFYRNPGADMMLSESDIDYKLIQNSSIFHFGSLSMTGEICEAATKKAVETAKESGAIISFDPNLRENLWDSLDKAREKIAYGISECDILKISDNEIQWFTGEQDFDRAVEILRGRYGNIKLLLLSLGKNGSRAYCGENSAFAPAAPANTIETTGAGDTFCGGILAKVLKYGLRNYSAEELTGILNYANSAAGIVTERRGALKVMPSPAEINERMERITND